MAVPLRLRRVGRAGEGFGAAPVGARRWGFQRAGTYSTPSAGALVPRAPVLPLAPVAPVLPVSPVAPVAPIAPAGPAGTEKQPARARAAVASVRVRKVRVVFMGNSCEGSPQWRTRCAGGVQR